MAANPRKFSEKIALHMQKQAEETSAFNEIIREVNATRGRTASGHLSIPDRGSLGAFRGGSLPNVCNSPGGGTPLESAVGGSGGDSSIDLQGALSHLESMKRGDVSPSRGRSHHRSRPGINSTSQSHRYDVSPYSSSNYLSPPHETNWRRTNSDSAINQSPSKEPFAPAGSPSHRRSTVNSCSTSEVMQQLGIYEWDQSAAQMRPKSAEVGGTGGFAPCPSPAHLSPPLGVHTPLSGSLPDLTNLHFASSAVASLDGSPESYQDCQGSPVRNNTGQQQQQDNMIMNPSQVSPPRITVEGLTLETIALSLDASNYQHGVGSPYSDTGVASPFSQSAPSSPMGATNCGPTPPLPPVSHTQQNSPMLHNIPSQQQQSAHSPSHNKYYDMMSNTMNSGNGNNFSHHNGIMVTTAGSIYDSFYNNMAELNKLNDQPCDISSTGGPPGGGGGGGGIQQQSYYESNLQSPGSTGIPDIILTEPGGAVDDCSNNSSKVLSSISSGGQFYTRSPSPTSSPCPHSPHSPHSPLHHHQPPPMDPMCCFDPSDLFQADQIDLESLQMLAEQEAAILAEVGGASQQSTYSS